MNLNLPVGRNKKVLVALSGGVDSSVAAALLIRQPAEAGYSVEGAYMRCWSSGAYCTADRDQADAAKVAATLNIPFHVFNFEKEYKEKVVEYFFSEYEAGRTPNPDVMCNKEIKFGLFLEKAKEMGFDFIATGHYARIRGQKAESRKQRAENRELGTVKSGYSLDGRSKAKLLTVVDPVKDQSLEKFRLLEGIDREKDQSYFLYQMGQEQLARSIFPLGEMRKKQVRSLAKEFGLHTAEKKDSTGICFIGPVDVRKFLAQRIKIRQGNVVSTDGRLIGRHKGLSFYTIGQREGLGVSESVPHYVVDKNLATNTLVAAPIGHNSLFKERFIANNCHLVRGEDAKLPEKLQVKLRYRAANVDALVRLIGSDKVEVRLSFPQRAITPGQSVVFYKNEEVIGGAIVEHTIN